MLGADAAVGLRVDGAELAAGAGPGRRAGREAGIGADRGVVVVVVVVVWDCSNVGVRVCGRRFTLAFAVNGGGCNERDAGEAREALLWHAAPSGV